MPAPHALFTGEERVPRPDSGTPDTNQGMNVSDERKKTGNEEKDRQVVVSVRFPAHLLQRIHAVAAVEDSTANAVIREGMDTYIRDRVRTEDFKEASRAYVERAEAHVATALQESTDEEERVHV